MVQIQPQTCTPSYRLGISIWATKEHLPGLVKACVHVFLSNRHPFPTLCNPQWYRIRITMFSKRLVDIFLFFFFIKNFYLFIYLAVLGLSSALKPIV